jgi:hypothetical protein
LFAAVQRGLFRDERHSIQHPTVRTNVSNRREVVDALQREKDNDFVHW